MHFDVSKSGRSCTGCYRCRREANARRTLPYRDRGSAGGDCGYAEADSGGDGVFFGDVDNFSGRFGDAA